MLFCGGKSWDTPKENSGYMILLPWEILAGKGGGEMERFSCGTTVISGRGAIEALKDCNCRRLLVVTEPGYVRAEQVRQILRVLNHPETKILDEVGPEATVQQAVEGSKVLKSVRPDLVVALGGRNAVDTGRAMVCFSGCPCTLAVVSTAFDSGCAVTDRVSLLHNGRRHLLQDSGMRPSLLILDSGFTEADSKGDIAENGFELLAESLEAYAAGTGGMIADIHAREAFASGWAALPAACTGEEQAKNRLRTAAVLTGLAVDRTGLGLCSAMQNSLGIVFGLSRGKAAGIVLPSIIGCNAHASGRRYAQLCRAAGLGGSREEIGIRNLRSGLIRLRRELGLPGTLLQAGVDIRTIWNSTRMVVGLTLEDPECRNNPVAVDDFVVRRILEEITGRF